MPGTPTPPPHPARRFLADRARVLALCVGLGAAALYLPTVRAGLVWDDTEYALADGGKHLAQALTGDLILGAAPAHGPSGYWRPLPIASFLAVRAVGNPAWLHHLASALLHDAAAALLVLLLVRRRVPLAAACAAAVLWAFHPAQSETVAWISARYDLLTGVLALALLLLPFRRSVSHPLALYAVFLAGLLSKESFAAIALAVVADDWAAHRGPRLAWPRWVAVAAALGTWLTLRAALGIPPVATPRLAGAPAELLATLAREAARAVAPLPLSVSHPVDPPTVAALAAGGALLAVLALLAWRVPRLAPAAALFVGPLVLAGVAIASLGEAPERYFYLPSLGLAWLLGEGLATLAAHRRLAGRERLGPLVAAALVGLAGAAALAGAVAVELRLPAWRSEEALFGAALEVDPGDAAANVWFGLTAARAGHLDEARDRLERAVASRPEAPRPAAALAWVHLRRGEAGPALETARRAVALGPSNPQARVFLANALHLAGDHAAELAEAAHAEALSPALREARIATMLARCEVEGAVCDVDLDRLYRDGLLVGADLLAAAAEAAIRYRNGPAAVDRVGRLRDSYPGDPRLRVLGPAAARLAGNAAVP
ncbi:MAG: tetratricopeptide repeat protein [Anaeromyxobacteraceae bacterium]